MTRDAAFKVSGSAVPGVKPVLKWPGGKRQLLPELLARVPASFTHYYEPFCGAAALFFDLRSRRWPGTTEAAHLGDMNPQLIRLYTWLRDASDMLCDHFFQQYVTPFLRCAEGEERRQFFEQVRADYNRDPNPRAEINQAAQLLFLNRACFNGLYRVNHRGEFNVPFGKYKTYGFPSREALNRAGLALQNTTLLAQSFEDWRVEPGSFIYIDPPYLKGFTAYTKQGFNFADQQRLAQWCQYLRTTGAVKLLISNADVPEVHRLYDGFRIERLDARRSINSDAKGRGPVGEVLISN